MELEELEREFYELKKIVSDISKKMESLENAILSQRSYGFERFQSKPRIKPFFVKGHDMPIVVTTPKEPIRGRFLTLKVLYDVGDRSLLVEEVCKETNRSRSLEVSYLNNLAKDGLVEKERDYIDGRERIRYKITEAGKRVIENLL